MKIVFIKGLHDKYTGSSGGLRAARVDPTSGALSLVRMRVSVYDQVW